MGEFESGMVFMKNCECKKRYECTIDSYKLFLEVKEFFENYENQGVFIKVPVEKPYYIWENKKRNDPHGKLEYYADAWYKCKSCGCLWEFTKPDFPALGFVKKYSDGIYTGTKEVIVNEDLGIVY